LAGAEACPDQADPAAEVAAEVVTAVGCVCCPA
jgi:hypothetical protein